MRGRLGVSEALAPRCGACERDLRPDARFCDWCGQPLQAVTSRGAELRTVTVLFADIVGFTSLSETLDPDDVHAILQRVFAVTDSAVRAWRGHVEKHIGDAMMALFGVPRGEPDDPVRAVRAALAIQARLSRLSSQLHSEGLPRVSVRIGVNTGRVVFGVLGDGTSEISVIGDAVNVASRLEAACPAGGVLVSGASWLHLRERFIAEPHAPVQAKGKAEPLECHRVLWEKRGLAYTAAAEVLGRQTRLVGRETELYTLMRAFARARSDSRSGMVTAVGRPGLGKSRLVDDFVERASEQRIHLLRARASTENVGVQFHLLRQIIRASAGVHDAMKLRELRTRLARWCLEPRTWRGSPAAEKDRADDGCRPEDLPVDPDIPTLEAADAIVRLLSLSRRGEARIAGSQDQRAATRALRAAMVRAARQAPLIIELDDLQWADASSLDFFVRLLGDLPDVPILVLATARPEFRDLRPEWGEGLEGAEHIDLEPLDEATCGAMVRHLLRGVRLLPVSLIDDLAARAAGNPYFAEELVKNLADQGVVVRESGEWLFRTERVHAVKTPPSVEALLQSRIDALADDELTMARLASVIGRAFLAPTLVDLAANPVIRDILPEAPAPEDVLPVLMQLGAKEVVNRAPAHGEEDPPLQFVHDLMREVVYSGMVKRIRRRLHLEVARHLEKGLTEDDERRRAPIIALHYRQATQFVDALRWHQRAARAVGSIGAFREALDQIEQALRMAKVAAEVAPGVRAELLLARGNYLSRLGRVDAAVATLQEVLEIAQEESDRAALARAHAQLSFCGYSRGDPEFTLTHAERAAGIADNLDDLKIRARAQNALGIAWGSRGYFRRAIEYYSRAAGYSEEDGDRDRLATNYSNIGINHYLLGEFDEAVRFFTRAIHLARLAGGRNTEAVALDNLGFVHLARGDIGAARDSFESALAISRTQNTSSLTAEVLYGLGEVALAEGELERADALATEVLGIAADAGLKVTMGQALRLRGAVAARRPGPEGPNGDAGTHFERSIELLRQTGERNELAESLLALGRHLDENDGDGAEHLTEAARLFDDLGMSWRLQPRSATAGRD